MDSLDERLNSIYYKIKDPSFKENKGLGNEVGYYVFDYPPEEELKVRDKIKQIKEKINNGNFNFKIYEYNLYELLYEFLKEQDYLDIFFKIEEDKGSDVAIDTISMALKSGGNGWINDYITNNTGSEGVVFITGVGQVFPMIRSHTILNTLHQQLDTVPVILFLPGKYDDNNLSLFESDASYYRAFRF